MDTIAEVWQQVLSVCKSKVSDTVFHTWIEPMVLVKFENNTFIFMIGSDFKKSVILDYFGDIIKDAFREVMGFPVEIDLFVSGAAEQDAPPEEPEQDKDVPSDGAGSRQFTFENFIVGRSNEFAYSVALGVANHPGTLNNPLMIYGRSGLGKTHLIYAIYNRLRDNHPNSVIIYVTGEAFMNELIQGMKNQNTYAFHQKYRNVDALLVDDIQFIQSGRRVQEEFFHTFNALQQAGKQIVMTSDVPPREMEILEERLRSRFEMGILADIQPPDVETRRAIILRKCDQLGITLSDDVVNLIAQKIKNNIRQIEGTVKKIAAMMATYSGAVTIEQVENIIKDITTDSQPTPVLVQKIIEFVAKSFGITAADIVSDNRQSNIALARQICMYVIKEVTDLKLGEIGKYFNKNHSTVLHSVDQAKAKMDRSPNVKSVANAAINEFQSKNV